MSTLQHTSPENPYSIEQVISRFIYLVTKVENREQRDDLLEVLGELPTLGSKEELQEVIETVIEILAPDESGGLVEGAGESSSEDREKLREWSGNIGKRIKTLRQGKDMSQEQLARLSDLTQSHISRLEKGQHSPSHQTVIALARALGVDPTEIDPGIE